ncbi:MAG: hypothetical protein ACLFRT_11885 [Actinomycetota bacterium]
MSDRVREAFEALIEQMEEPPTWEDLTAADHIAITSVSEDGKPAPNVRRGPLVAVAAAVLVAFAALVPLLSRPAERLIADEVLSAVEGPARFAVGFNADGELCAQAGSATQSELVCGREGFAAVGFQAYRDLTVAGFVPGSSAEVAVIYADGRRRSVELTPIPGRDESAFGSILRAARPDSVEIEVTDDQGVVTHRRSVPVGSIADALGWETVAIPDLAEPGPMGAIWTGAEFIFSHGYAYTPDNRSWRELPSLADLAPFGATTGVWTGSETIFCCGFTGSAAVHGLDTFHKTSNAPFHLDLPSEAVWTGDLMLVVSEGAGVASYNPESDHWELLGEPPRDLAIGFGPSYEVSWTESELVVWTVNELGVALDPETRAWRILPEPPDTITDAFTHDDVVYTGTELIVWGASSHSSPPEPVEAVGAMLDLETGAWIELPELPVNSTACECRLRGGQAMVWTGDSLLISTSHLSRDAETSEPVLIAYHPATDSWTYEGVSPLGWDFSSFDQWGERAVMAGDRVVLISDHHLYISPPGWRPQGEPIPTDLLYAVEQR